ncbi:AraC family transcriptional regulator [Acinetobacter sp. C32I]|uniref:AraC family transcriptional regulator n=1 Tax=Acinetobacter sp. C32I TaxID=2950074 RepID=UPI002036D80D|nr:AraC family transcriptional regulator [Acinetobacter sp. C32I]USA55386.1 AraC family transcriptional regulator [Acinetobacter sp. C32I]
MLGKTKTAMGQHIYRRVIPETFVQLLYEYLDEKGYSPEELLEEPWPEPDPQGIGGINVEHWNRMLETAAEQLKDPLLGIHLGQTITARHLGVLGSVFLASENLEAAIVRLNQYFRLVFDVVPMVLRRGNNWIDITWDESEYITGALVNVTGYAVLVQFCRTLVRGTVNPVFVHFKHPRPTDISPYEEFFSCPVLFGQSEVAVRYSSEILHFPLKSPDAALISILEQHADRLLAQLPQQYEIVEQVRQLITRALHDGEPDIERISAKLNCSSRTLQRRLTEAGTNFRHELNLVRYELATSYLQDPRLHIMEIAMLLGYSEHSAFTRAFKEWSGITPQQARDK